MPRPRREIDGRLLGYAAELRGSSIRERIRKRIGSAHPKFRNELMRQASKMGYV